MPVMRMTVVHPDREVEVEAGPKQQVAFEKHHKKGIGAAFTSELRMSDIYWLAWKCEQDHVAKHGGDPVPLFDAWLDQIVDVRLDGEESHPGPL